MILSFIVARLQVAPKRQQTILQLELCAAVTGAQLAKVLQRESIKYLTLLHLDHGDTLTQTLTRACCFLSVCRSLGSGSNTAEVYEETKAQTSCGHISTTSTDKPDSAQYSTEDELLQATYQSLLSHMDTDSFLLALQ